MKTRDRLRSGNQPETAGAATDAFDVGRPVDLCEEGGDRIAPAYLVAGGVEQYVPLLVVDWLTGADLSAENLDRYLA